jgi:hypothetical protein
MARTEKAESENQTGKKARDVGVPARQVSGANSKTSLQIRAERAERRREDNPDALLSTREAAALKKWNLKRLREQEKAVREQKASSPYKLKKSKKRRNVVLAVPRTVQDTIPYIQDYEEGVFEVAPNKYSKLYRLKDINYLTSDVGEQESIFIKLAEFYNYFSEEMNFAITIDNRNISIEEQERRVLYPLTGDSYDGHRKEYNKILRQQIVRGKNDIQTEKLLSVTIDADTPIEAIAKFRNIDGDVRNSIVHCGSVGGSAGGSDAVPLSTEERLSYYHDIFRKGREGELYDIGADTYSLDFDFIKAQGISTKDYVAPGSFQFKNRHFRIDGGYYRVMYFRDFPRTLGDDFLHKFTDNDFPVTTTLSVQPLDLTKAIRLVKRQQTSIDMNVIDAEKRAIRAGYNPETIQPSLKQAKRYTDKMVEDIMNNDQKLFFVTISVMVYGKTMDDLEENCETLMGKARSSSCTINILSMQQEDGMKVTMPFGYTSKNLHIDRALTTDSTVVFMPFANQELFQFGGFYYGLNRISRNLIICNRTKMKQPSGFVLGKPGAGKSFAVKREILNVLLADGKTNVLIIDPENEYGDFARAFGGTVLNISVSSDNHINPFDMPEDYGLDENDDVLDTSLNVKKDKALRKKSEFIMSIVEGMLFQVGGGGGEATLITPQQKTIIDRCVRTVYREYLEHDFDTAYIPTMADFQAELDRQRYISETRVGGDGKKAETLTVNDNAVAIAETVEYYSKGSLDVFSKHTDVDFSNRLVVFNVKELGDQLRQIALTIVFDFVWSRMTANKQAKIRTYCYCDEIHVMFQSYFAATFMRQLYKRGRKYGLVITGITQNAEELLRTEQARQMIGNSEFVLMLSQFAIDLEILSKLLHITPSQMGFVIDASEGCGLLFAEGTIVPFEDRFPNTSYLYKLMSTKFAEELNNAEIEKQISSIMAEMKNAAQENRDETEEETEPRAGGDMKHVAGGRFLVEPTREEGAEA